MIGNSIMAAVALSFVVVAVNGVRAVPDQEEDGEDSRVKQGFALLTERNVAIGDWWALAATS